jgi:Ca2+-binding RTX toxin-like protein
LVFPNRLRPGTYYLGALADYNNRIVESNEHNNASNVVRVILGNRGSNLLIGTSGNDVMIGGAGRDTFAGGPGKDVLDGGPGADHFVFNAALNPQKNLDTIVDFTPGVDKIVLSESHFAGIGRFGHLLSASHFTIGAAASTHAERIIYDPGNGHLYYDRDGGGGHGQIHFATITTGLALQSSDFLVAA